MRKLRMGVNLSVLAVVVSACNGDKPEPAAEAPATEQAPAAAMPGMGANATIDAMEAHLSAAVAAEADSMKVMLPAHRQLVANMLSEFGRDMQSMKADATWDALADSVRSDLTRMPDLSAADLKARMDAHAARVRRLMEMHRGMMGGMKM